jgi:hypothetical protein
MGRQRTKKNPPISTTHHTVVKSSARRRKPPITALNMSESRIQLKEKKIKTFIETLDENVPIIVNIPMPKDKKNVAEYHAILLYIEGKQIFVSDWGGDRRTREHKRYYNTPHWFNYKLFLKLLESELKKKVIFVEVDEKLAKEAMDVHNSRTCERAPSGEGGCSYYIYNWTAAHLDDLISGKKPEPESESESESEPAPAAPATATAPESKKRKRKQESLPPAQESLPPAQESLPPAVKSRNSEKSVESSNNSESASSDNSNESIIAKLKKWWHEYFLWKR